MIRQPVIHVSAIIALAILFIIGCVIAYHYRAVHGFRDFAIFLAFAGIAAYFAFRK